MFWGKKKSKTLHPAEPKGERGIFSDEEKLRGSNSEDKADKNVIHDEMTQQNSHL